MRVMIYSLLLMALFIINGCNTTGSQTGFAGNDFFSNDSNIDDNSIETAVKNALQQDDLLAAADIQVNADQGVVTLSGTVPNATAYLRALRIARDVEGVRPPVKAIELTYPQ